MTFTQYNETDPPTLRVTYKGEVCEYTLFYELADFVTYVDNLDATGPDDARIMRIAQRLDERAEGIA